MNCPEHSTTLIEKPVLYGYITPEQDTSGYLLGGCVVRQDSPEFGYECPIDKAVFYLKDGKLVKEEAEE